MHSKWKIWDFVKARPDILEGDSRVIAFSCFDPLVFKILKESFPKKRFEEEKLGVLLGKEVTTQWFDDNFKSLGLFGNSESFLVHFAEELNSSIKDELAEVENLIIQDRFLILSFSKEDSFYKKLQKSKSTCVETIQIQAPAFWEENETLEFLCDHLKVYLTFGSKEKIKEKIPFNINSYYQLLTQIKVNFGETTNIDVADIIPLFSEVKVDQFELADLFGTKKLKVFYSKMLESISDGNEIIGLLYFLQSHLIKMYDLSYLDKKSKLSKYDKKVMAHSKLWKKNDIVRAINYLAELLILSKKKTPALDQKFKQGFLKTMNFQN